MKNNTIARVRLCADIFLLFAVLVAPWWAVSLFALGCIFFFKNFYEAFFAGFFLDALYGANIAGVYGFRFFFSGAALLALLAAEMIKRSVRR